MNKKQLMEEMLTEVKNLKDLTKEELPLIAKEYILAQKVSAIAGLSIAALLLISSLVLLHLGNAYVPKDHYDNDAVGYYLACELTGTVSFIMAFCNGSNLLDLTLQPRRMAIKAITSLMGE